MTTNLTVTGPVDLSEVATGSTIACSPPLPLSRGSEEDEEATQSASSPYEQSAIAALLGLQSASPSSPDDDAVCRPFGADTADRLWEHSTAAAAAAGGNSPFGYRTPEGEYSPNCVRYRPNDYDTPGYPSPKRMRAPKDGAPPPGTSRFRCKYPGCQKL